MTGTVLLFISCARFAVGLLIKTPYSLSPEGIVEYKSRVPKGIIGPYYPRRTSIKNNQQTLHKEREKGGAALLFLTHKLNPAIRERILKASRAAVDEDIDFHVMYIPSDQLTKRNTLEIEWLQQRFDKGNKIKQYVWLWDRQIYNQAWPGVVQAIEKEVATWYFDPVGGHTDPNNFEYFLGDLKFLAWNVLHGHHYKNVWVLEHDVEWVGNIASYINRPEFTRNTDLVSGTCYEVKTTWGHFYERSRDSLAADFQKRKNYSIFCEPAISMYSRRLLDFMVEEVQKHHFVQIEQNAPTIVASLQWNHVRINQVGEGAKQSNFVNGDACEWLRFKIKEKQLAMDDVILFHSLKGVYVAEVDISEQCSLEEQLSACKKKNEIDCDSLTRQLEKLDSL